MNVRINSHGQPIGPALPDWKPRPMPQGVTLTGRYGRLEPLDPVRHGPALAQAYADATGDAWTYLPVSPPPERAALDAYLRRLAAAPDARHFAIVDGATESAVGTLALMRMDPINGVVEVGAVTYAPVLRRSRLATEAQYLLMRHVFDELGYRRYEWKCDSLNAPSRAAAERLGFRFEGIFRQAMVYQGRSRDTAWFSIIDGEWPLVAPAFERWLEPGNFDDLGQQRQSLLALRTEHAPVA